MVRLFIVIVLLIGLTSCGSGSTITGELIGEIESKANIGEVTAEQFDPTWLPVAKRKELLDDFLTKIKANKFEVFEYMPGDLTPMSNKDLQYIFHHVDTDYVEDDMGYMQPLPIEEIYDESGIVYLKFKEDLYYNFETGLMEKQIKYVCPMEQVYNEDGSTRGYRGLFWVKFK